MLKSRLVLLSCALAIAGLVTAASVARGNAHTVYLTFSAPVALPGVALPAGTYVFEVMLPGSLDIVRVSSRDGAHVYFTAFTQRVNRPVGRQAESQVIFNEVPRGMTPSIKVWFPIGEPIGHEFIYGPNSQLRTAATN